MRVVLQHGVTLLAKRGEYISKGDKLLKIENVSDIVVEGGALPLPPQQRRHQRQQAQRQQPFAASSTWPELRMWRSDYGNASLYNKSEYRHGIAVESATRVRISRLRVVETGGDGIYLLNRLVEISYLVFSFREDLRHLNALEAPAGEHSVAPTLVGRWYKALGFFRLVLLWCRQYGRVAIVLCADLLTS